MAGPPGSGSTAGLSGPQFLVTYANGIIANNAQFPVAVARFKQLLTGINYNTASLNDIATLWSQAINYQDAQGVAGIKPAAPTYIAPTLPAGQYQLNQPGVPYVTSPQAAAVANIDLSPLYAAIAASAAKNPAIDPSVLAGYVAQIEQNHQAQQAALAAQFASILQSVTQTNIQDHQQFLAAMQQAVQRTFPGQGGPTTPQPQTGGSLPPEVLATINQTNASSAAQAAAFTSVADKVQSVVGQNADALAHLVTLLDPNGPLFKRAPGAPEQPSEDILDPIRAAAIALAEMVTALQSMAGEITAAVEGTGAAVTSIGLDQSVGTLSDMKDRAQSLMTMIENVRTGQYKTLADFEKDYDNLININGFFSLVHSIFLIIPVIVDIIKAPYGPFNESLTQLARAENPVTLLDPMTLMSSVRRENQDIKWVTDQLRKHGLSADNIELLYKLSDVKLDLGSLYELVRRGDISTLEFGNAAATLGYEGDNIELLYKLKTQQLQPQDIVRLADKHIFSKDIPQIFGQYTEFDTEFTDRMSRHGYSEDDVLKLWAAHWELPSPQLIFDMLHRGQITDAEMEVYFKLTDWLPFFRDKLKNISYTTLTRVDIRRMYKAGVISDQQMHRAHLDIGYNEVNARLLDDFVKRTSRTDDNAFITKLEAKAETAVESAYVHGRITRDEAKTRLVELGVPAGLADAALHVLDLERADSVVSHKLKDHTSSAISAVISAYSRGSLARNDAHNFLLALGYTEADAEHELLILELDRDIKQKERFIEHAEALYVGHVITFAELTSMLESEGFAGDEIQRISTDLVERRQYRNKRPTEAQVVKWFKSGIIDDQQLADELRGVGYSDKHIGYFLQELVGAPVQ